MLVKFVLPRLTSDEIIAVFQRYGGTIVTSKRFVAQLLLAASMKHDCCTWELQSCDVIRT